VEIESFKDFKRVGNLNLIMEGETLIKVEAENGRE
jgi:hypothetical protein